MHELFVTMQQMYEFDNRLGNKISVMLSGLQKTESHRKHSITFSRTESDDEKVLLQSCFFPL